MDARNRPHAPTHVMPGRRAILGMAPFATLAIVGTACGVNDPADSTTSMPSTTAEASSSVPAALAFALTATGQTVCYDDAGEEITCPADGEAFYGQDAQFADGDSMSYTDNGDGTVTDDVTGLTWQQVPSPENMTWQEAIDYTDELELGGYDDWRTPSAKELYSIADFSSGWPYLDTTYFSLASDEVSKDEQYWTSNHYVGTTVEGGSDAAFGVNAVTGHIKAYAAEATGPVGGKYVRAVRGATYGENSFVDNGDGTVADESTSLMWAQGDDGVELDWKDALAYANDSQLGGYSDWRLPNVKELQSIVDYSTSPSATDAGSVGAAIDDVFTSTEMTNEAGESDYGYYWTSTSASFTRGEPTSYAWYVAFGRAVNAEGQDFHGAGAVRFDTKTEEGPDGEGGERYTNFVRLVRHAS